MDLANKEFHFSKKRIETLQRLSLYTSEDVLTYYPYRFEIITKQNMEEWKIKEKVIFEGIVISRVVSFRKGRFVTSRFDVMHDSNVIKITIFNRPWANKIPMQATLTITGIYMGNGKVTATNYDMKPLSEHDAITPVYSLKEGIQQRTIRDSIAKVYEVVQNEIRDVIPAEFIYKYRLLRKSDALRRIHFPENETDIKLAFRTLKYEEFLRFFIAILMNRNDEGFLVYKEPKIFDPTKVDAQIKALPFSLTQGQKEALSEILKDMSSTKPMYRLVQGDVGCGKTVVAAMSMYACAISGKQAALLAPTEILAQQHLSSLQAMIHDSSIHMAVLYSGIPNSEREKILAQTKSGEIDILVGTHAILQDDVLFHDLGFVVADEQQRFGVEQRKALRKKGTNTDFLLMSATPIPRTLASAIFGGMDVSTIETLPTGRKTPITKLIQENSFRSVLEEVNELLAQGHQLYVICAAVEENEEYKARDVHKMCETLSKVFPREKVGMLHGKMHANEKEIIMHAFAENKIQILVSTTVVEVGMNVINATGMIIYDADRFGLSQLHQLRGRIQRGNTQGKCWLLTDNKSQDVLDRLNVLVRSNDGFEIAKEDLRLRGAGDILGTRQSGVPDLILGNFVEDAKIIETAKKDAEKIVEHSENPDYVSILESVRLANLEKSTYVD